jgi:hypothetical protein
MDAGFVVGVDLGDRLAQDIHYAEAYVVGFSRDPIIDPGAAAGVLTSEVLLAGANSSLRLTQPTNRSIGFKEVGVGGKDFGGHLTKRRHIEDPYAAAVCGRHDFTRRGVNSDFMHGHGRQVVVELGPVFSAIDGNPAGELRSQIQ